MLATDKLTICFLLYCDLSDIFFGMLENEDKYDLFTLVTSCIVDNELWIFSSKNRESSKSKQALKQFINDYGIDVEPSQNRVYRFYPSVYKDEVTENIRSFAGVSFWKPIGDFIESREVLKFFNEEHESDYDSSNLFSLNDMRVYKSFSISDGPIAINIYKNKNSNIHEQSINDLLNATAINVISRWREIVRSKKPIEGYQINDINAITEKSFDEVYFRNKRISSCFRTVTLITSLYYEKGHCKGRICITDGQIKDLDNSRIYLGSIGFIEKNRILLRKLLKMTENGYELVVDISDITEPNLYAISRQSDVENECCFVINGHLDWAVVVAEGDVEKPLLRFKNDRYFVPQEDEFENFYVPNRLKLLQANDSLIQSSIELISCLRRNNKGATLIICDSSIVQNECDRLCNQGHGFKIQNENCNLFKNTDYEQVIKALSAIDGAILIDTNMRCHAIGIILDGDSSEIAGDLSRGSRFNSAKTYVLNQNNFNYSMTNRTKIHPTIAMIISDDGYIDILPKY